MVAIEIILTIVSLIALVLLVMVADLYERCRVMRVEIDYHDNCRKVLYDTLYEHLKIHVEKGEKELGGKNDKGDGFQRTC